MPDKSLYEIKIGDNIVWIYQDIEQQKDRGKSKNLLFAR